MRIYNVAFKLIPVNIPETIHNISPTVQEGNSNHANTQPNRMKNHTNPLAKTTIRTSPEDSEESTRLIYLRI